MVFYGLYTLYENISQQNNKIINMSNQLMSPGWGKDKDSVCNACECLHARNREPTVPEKQVA